MLEAIEATGNYVRERIEDSANYVRVKIETHGPKVAEGIEYTIEKGGDFAILILK